MHPLQFKREWRSACSNHRDRGAALVLMLLAILVLTSLIVLFFTLATSDRTNTNSYAQSMKADELAVGAMELVIEELRNEIADTDRSNVLVSSIDGAPTIYVPTEAKYLLPERTVSGTTSNLIKMSQRTIPLYADPDAAPLASQSSSATASRNGRAITLDRWEKAAFGAFTGTSAMPAPDWVYFNRKGNVTDPTISAARDHTGEGFVIGRSAFAVYDISGLLDANVAGYPTALSAKEAGRKGSTALARLQSIGLDDEDVDNLVAFRNALSRTTYLDYLGKSEQHKGFTKTVPGDNRFLSRQELLRFAKVQAFEDKLPLLTVFSRELNAPTHAPPTGAGINASVNPNLATLRHTNTGRLLFEKRFPLSRLALFQDPANNAADIAKYFGLTYDSGTRSFTYKTSTIKSAAQLAASPAYPEIDFFETLKAGILEGSIGQSAGTTATASDDPDKDAHIMQIGANIIDQYDLDEDRDANGVPIPIPTTIAYGAKTLYGVENLPYVNKIHILGENPKSTPISENVGNMPVGYENPFKNLDLYNFLVSAELWNPNFQRLPDEATDYNPQIQLNAKGATQVTLYASSDASYTGSGPGVGAATPPEVGASQTFDDTRTIHVNDDLGSYLSYGFFSEPHHVRLSRAMAQLNYAKNTRQAGNPDYLKFCFNSAKITINSPISVELAVLDEDGIPRVYQRTLPTAISELKMSERIAPPNSAAGRVGASTSIIHGDPRTNRLGYFGLDFRPSNVIPTGAQDSVAGPPPEGGKNPRGSLPQFYEVDFAPNTTAPFSLRPRFDKFGKAGDSNGYGIGTTDGVPQSSFSPLSTGLFLGLLWENSVSATRIQDPDGQFRLGDGGFAPSSSVPNPYEPIQTYYEVPWTPPNPWPGDGSRPPGTNSARPVLLDRPFRSVADLGYTYRDIPWRSLNFSGTDSADSALLDIFCIEDTDINAGRVNLNSAHPDALQAILAGSLKEESGAIPASIGDSEAEETAKILTTFTGTAPLLNVSEIVTKFSTPGNITQQMLGNGTNGHPSRAIKTQRESVIRALAGSTQTRTWNFLIDLVAQTGRFPNNASTLDDFIVEGERRYWLHVAIDRYTGEIVDELIEQVSE